MVPRAVAPRGRLRVTLGSWELLDFRYMSARWSSSDLEYPDIACYRSVYPSSWGFDKGQMTMKKRVMAVLIWRFATLIKWFQWGIDLS